MSIYRVDKKNSGYPDSHLFKNSFFEKLFRIEIGNIEIRIAPLSG